MKANELLLRFLIWRVRHVNTKNFVLFLSGVIGALSGIAAVTLKEAVHFIQDFLTGGFDIGYANLLYLSYPLLGILITVFLTDYILREKNGHGISDTLYSISKKSSLIRKRRMYSKMVTSALTVGFGGSVGLESPIVVTGSAIGSNTGRMMHLNYKKRTLLIGCGAAGAISAIFNSPIAGVIFSIEVMLADVTFSGLIPLLISSVSGSLVSLTLLGDDILFSFKLQESFRAEDTPLYILLGVVCGLTSVYFTRVMYRVENWVGKIKNHLSKAVLGGIGLGLIIFIFPPIYGEGYETIKDLLAGSSPRVLEKSLFFTHYFEDNWLLVLFLVGVMLVKPVASALTIAAGGSGGIFAPSLFLGGVTGFVFARVVGLTGIDSTISLSNFTLVGMCGVMSGILHAPMTAIFLIAEVTGGYTLFVPLMLVSAIAFSTISYFEKYSLYTKNLVERGDLTYDRDRQVLSLIDLNKIIEKDLLIIDPEKSLGDLVKLVRLSKRNIFPVVNNGHELVGIITLDDIREIMFDEDSRKNITVKSLMHSPPAYVSSHETMQSVMMKFEKSGAWNLPVIDDGEYIGFVSKSRIFNAYRKKLIRQNREF
ncbi:chloride channel protein [Roseivirga sp. BDSF3-8]|uniref:chloride channel protein n=1 Tax=Roseivirga sp. BDSF3-8 TaxID=3241598 RepID=UPI0035326483